MICDRCQIDSQHTLKIDKYQICESCSIELLEHLISETPIEDASQRISYLRLLEQASDLGTARSKVFGLYLPILIHVCKIYFLRNAKEKNHWRKELANWIVSISKIKLKTKRGRFDRDWLFENLFSDYIWNVKQLSNIIKNDVNPELEKDQINIDHVSKRDIVNISNFYREMCSQINYRELSNTDVYAIIDKFLS